VTSVLNRQTARDVAVQVERIATGADVVIDLTGIAGFDTDGAAALMHLQEAAPEHRVSIVGLRQATARLVGDVDLGAPATSSPDTGWVIRQLRNLVVVQAAGGATPSTHEPTIEKPGTEEPSTDTLEPVLTAATQTQAAIVVVDLRGVEELTADGLHALTFASSTAAVRGQELLVVNVSPQAAEALRTAGLSATTFVAPEPPLDNLPGTGV
jgi:anti-anti-sigma regulatory factor